MFLSQVGFRHITRTGVRDFDYVYKTGNYYCSWEKVRKEHVDVKLYDWQRTAVEHVADDREIEFYVDLLGNAGKTFFGKWLESQHKACYIPPLGRASDILSCVMEKPRNKWYIIDMPRAMPFSRDFYSAVEMVKNGVIYDHRYKYREIDLGYNPRVSVFCNEVPERLSSYLSRDRINIRQITTGDTSIWGRECLQIIDRPDWKNWEEPKTASADRRHSGR